MTKSLRKILSCALVLMMMLALMPAANAIVQTAEYVYPLETDVTLQYFLELNGTVSIHYGNFGDTEFAKEWQERTGINVEFRHTTTSDAFTLMWISDDIPDIVEYWWGSPFGGLLGAINEDAIIPLNELFDYAPNYRAWLDANPGLDKQIQFEGGVYTGFPSILGSGESYPATQGFFIRQDYLDAFGLEMPVTLADWENVLTVFKENGIEVPLSIPHGENLITRAFGLRKNFYIDGDVMKYGQYEDNFKEYLTLINRWYTNGLIDQDMATLDTTTRMSKYYDGTAGAGYGWLSNYESVIINGPAVSGNPDFNMVPAPFPMLTEDSIYNEYSGVEGVYAPGAVYTAITRASKNPDLATRFMDYLWSEDGYMLANWGIEGLTYELDANGDPQYTEFTVNNPDGWTLQEIKSGYMRSYSSGPHAQDIRGLYAGFNMQEQFDAMEVWNKDATTEHLAPPYTRNQEEDEEYRLINSSVSTAVSENVLKFMLGTRSLDEFEQFQAELEALGIERLIEIETTALQRALNK